MSKQLEQAIENGQPIDPEMLIQGAPVLVSILDIIFGKRKRELEKRVASLESALQAVVQVNSMQDFLLKELQNDINHLSTRS